MKKSFPILRSTPGKIRASLLCVLVGLFQAAAACTGGNFSAMHPGLEQRGHYIEGVSFYRHRGNECGPAAVAAVVSYWGVPVSLDRISERIYLQQLGGTLPMDMEHFLRDAGFETHSFAGTLNDIKKQIRRNVPVISLLDEGFGPYRRPHYVTVIGFDDLNRAVIAHDGTTENNVIGYDTFMRQWARAGTWMLVAVPSARLGGRKP